MGALAPAFIKVQPLRVYLFRLFRGVLLIGCKGVYKEWISPEGLEKIRGWVKRGYTNKQISTQIGINNSTFCDWLNSFPQLRETVAEARKPVVEDIENGLYTVCGWHESTETTTEIITHTDGKIEKRETVKRKRIPPNVNALIFALRNIAPDRWKQNPTTDNTNGADVFKDILTLMKGATDANNNAK